MKIIIHNQMSEISQVNDVIEDIAKPWGLSLRVSSQLSLVLDELLSNIIRYGFRDDKIHDIKVSMEIQNDRLLIEVRDDGIEFNPLLYPEPDFNPNLAERVIGGLGIHIIRKLTQDFIYLRENGCNIQKFCKILNA